MNEFFFALLFTISAQAGATTLICTKTVNYPKLQFYTSGSSSTPLGGSAVSATDSSVQGELKIDVVHLNLNTYTPKVTLNIYRNNILIYTEADVMNVGAKFVSTDGELTVEMACGVGKVYP